MITVRVILLLLAVSFVFLLSLWQEIVLVWVLACVFNLLHWEVFGRWLILVPSCKAGLEKMVPIEARWNVL